MRSRVDHKVEFFSEKKIKSDRLGCIYVYERLGCINVNEGTGNL